MTIVYSSLNHPLRVPLAAEVHSRPFLRVAAPERITHLAVFPSGSTPSGGVVPDGADGGPQHAALADLCARFGVAAPATGAKYFFHDFGRFRLKWECHTEFATYTFAQRHEAGTPLDAAFGQVPLHHLPQEWLLALGGRIMVAAHVVLCRGGRSATAPDPLLRRVFEGANLVGSRTLHGGEIWTDFLIQSDGFARFVVYDHGMHEQEPGRLVQRLLEIETYRMMALVGLPEAQRAGPLLNAIEGELATLTAAMVDGQGGAADAMADGEQALLRDITGLAARIEKLALETSYRFAASQAYFRLVRARIDELRESRIEGLPTIGEFMERRLAPAMNTCDALARRQETLAARIAHTNDLLRTRVGIVQERQNRQILESLNRRAAQQVRLQQAVEGLSVVAISYYLAGLFGYVAKSAKAAGWPVDPDLATGLLIPVIAGAVWLGLRQVHRRMHRAG